MLGELVQVGLLLLELLLQLQELLLLALADGVVLGGLLAAGEGITTAVPLVFSLYVHRLLWLYVRAARCASVALGHADGAGGKGPGSGAQSCRAGSSGELAKHFRCVGRRSLVG